MATTRSTLPGVSPVRIVTIVTIVARASGRERVGRPVQRRHWAGAIDIKIVTFTVRPDQAYHSYTFFVPMLPRQSDAFPRMGQASQAAQCGASATLARRIAPS